MAQPVHKQARVVQPGLRIAADVLENANLMGAFGAACCTIAEEGLTEDSNLFVEVDHIIYLLEFIRITDDWEVGISSINDRGAGLIRKALCKRRTVGHEPSQMPCWMSTGEAGLGAM